MDLEKGLECWGHDDGGQLDIPDNLKDADDFFFAPLLVATTCAQKNGGLLDCWGKFPQELKAAWSGLRNVRNIQNSYHDQLCGEEGDGARKTLKCFKAPIRFTPQPADLNLNQPPAATGFSSFGIGYSFACVLNKDDFSCWGDNPLLKRQPPSQRNVKFLSTTGFSACLGRSDQTVGCWEVVEDYQTLYKGKNLQAVATYTGAYDSGIYLVDDGLLKHVTPKQVRSLTQLKNPVELKAGPDGNFCVQDGDVLTCSAAPNAPMLAKTLKLKTSRLSPPRPYSHACFLDGGQILCLGSGNRGQLGYGSEEPVASFPKANPVSLPKNFKPRKVLSVLGRSCALSEEGQIFCWGLTDGIDLSLFNKHVRDFSLGEAFLCALSEGDVINCTGKNYGVLPDLKNFKAISLASGFETTCVLNADGESRCFGSRDLDLPSENLPPFKKIALGAHHACGIRVADDTLACFGQNQFGQLLQGNTQDLRTPTSALLGSDITAKDLSCGNYHCCIVTLFNTLKCWGNNTFGQLGLGDTVNRGISYETTGDNLAATKTPSNEPLLAVEAFDDSTCITTKSGRRCWGYNGMGQLGYGDFLNKGDTPDTLPKLLPPVIRKSATP